MDFDISSAQVQKWCDRHQYSKPQFISGQWWAIPPKAFIPVPIGNRLKRKPIKSISEIAVLVGAIAWIVLLLAQSFVEVLKTFPRNRHWKPGRGR